MFKKGVVGLATTLFSVMAMADNCELSADFVGATYKMTQVTHGQKETKKSNTLKIYRKDGLVAHLYPERNYSEVWNQVRDGKVRPVRYFDADKRAIEYAPGDINKGKGDSDWLSKYQLIDLDSVPGLKKVSESGEGCGRVATYKSETDAGVTQIEWLPVLRLVKNFSFDGKNLHNEWQMLEQITDDKEIAEVFASREAYISTDYADIGDNETDPFFRKLINLGFISHGASGFYNAEGEVMEGGHGHHH